MKKLLAITLTLCMIFSVLVVPVSAAGGYINKDVTADAVAYFYGGATNQLITITENAGYEASKAIDGSADSIFYGAEFNATKTNHNSHHMLLVDLGGPVDITSLTLTKATSDQYTAAREALGASFTKTMNESGCVFATNTIPEFAEFSGANYTGDGVVLQTNLNDGTISDSSDEMYQYVGVWVPYSSGVAVAELKVMADVWANHLQTVEKQITPVSAIYANNDLANETTNKATNVIDNDETTFALADKNSGTYFSIDLGAAYDLTKVEVVFPDDTSITNFITANNFSTDAADKFNSACRVWASNTSSGEDFRINSEGQNMASLTTKTWNGINGDTEYRYITFYSGQASSPVAISEVRVYGYVTEELVVDADITATKVQYGVEKTNIAENAEVKMYQSGSNTLFDDANHSGAMMVDGDENSFAYIKKQWGSSPASTNYAVVDLGSQKNIGAVNISVPTLEEITAATTYTNTSNYPPSAVNTVVAVALTNTYPTAENFSAANGAATFNGEGLQINDGARLTDGFSWTNTTGEALSYQYIVIYAPFSYGAAVSELSVYDDAAAENKLRFFFTGDHNIAEPSAFGAYITPVDLLEEYALSGVESVIVRNEVDAASFVNGATFAADLTDIPADYYDTAIIALPFVEYDGYTYYGTAKTVTVNEVIAAQQ